MGLPQKASAVKKPINKMQSQPTTWEKILVNDISNKELTSKICRELTELNTNKQSDQKMGGGQT